MSDQLAMARLPRATFALLLSLLPGSAALIGILVLHQIPTPIEITGILLVAGGVALHKEAQIRPSHRTKSTDDRTVESQQLEAASTVHTD